MHIRKVRLLLGSSAFIIGLAGIYYFSAKYGWYNGWYYGYAMRNTRCLVIHPLRPVWISYVGFLLAMLGWLGLFWINWPIRKYRKFYVLFQKNRFQIMFFSLLLIVIGTNIIYAIREWNAWYEGYIRGGFYSHRYDKEALEFDFRIIKQFFFLSFLGVISGTLLLIWPKKKYKFKIIRLIKNGGTGPK